MRLPRQSPYRSLTLVVALLVLALLLLLLDQSGRLGSVRSQAEVLLSPALASFQRLGDRISGVGQELSSVQQLRARNTELEALVSQLQSERIQNQALTLRVEQLEKQLAIEQAKPWKLLSADVAALTPDAGRHVLMLAAGSDDGVEVGMAVIAQEGGSPPALIGVVDQVTSRNATVLLITDYNSQISVKVYHEGTVANGIVQGQFQRGSWLRLEQVDRASPLAVGDTVVTAGLTAQMDLDLPRGAIPSDVPIGTVERVELDGQNQMAELRPYINPDQVRKAWVILSHDD